MNVIHSGLLKKLNGKYHVHLLSTLLGEPEMQHLNRYYGMEAKLINGKIPHEHYILRVLRRFEKLLFCIVFEIETQEIKILRVSPILQKVFRCVRSSSALAFLAKILLVRTRNAIILLSKCLNTFPELLAYHFDGVISTSPLDIRENCIVNFLATNRIRSMAMVISWDNLTSKGIMNANHRYVLVWNRIMANEYERFYNAFSPRAQVCITGIPRFDIYFQNRDNPRRKEDFHQKFSIPENHQIILFATSAQKHFPYQMVIVKQLVEYIRKHPSLTLMIRCHPDDPLEAYKLLLAEPRVRIWHPRTRICETAQTFSNWLPSPDFLHSLHEILRNCDVCVQVASTIRLDAAACGKPIISIAYDAHEDTPYANSVKGLYDYSHQLPLNQLRVDQMVYSEQQLIIALNEALSKLTEPGKPVDSIRLFTHFTKPRSVSTVLKYVDEWLR